MYLDPFYDTAGQLLGFVDRHLAYDINYGPALVEVQIEDTPANYNEVRADDTRDTIAFFRLTNRTALYRNDDYELRRQEVPVGLLTAEEPVPDWVWETGRAIKFDPAAFRRRGP